MINNLNKKASDIDLDFVFNDESLVSDKTSENNNTWLFRYANFVEIPSEQCIIISNPAMLKKDIMPSMIPKEYFCDDLIAKFLYNAFEIYDKKPHQRKAIINMLTNALFHHNLPAIFIPGSVYNQTHKVLKVITI